ncbi:hypothetical protein FQR65_LT12949 [Abscondita terminalis]|nr:hypothetical protein FQR65_LT12949 [Abscondita terminalis]
MNLHELNNVNNYIEVPALDYVPDPRGFGSFIYDFMVQHKDKIAQVDAKTGKTETYGELLHRCVRTSVYLRKIGVKSGDFISVCTYNHLNTCVPSIAGFFINAIMSAVDPILSLEDTTHLLNQTKPKVIFTTLESVETIEAASKRIGIVPKIVVFGNTDDHVNFIDIITRCYEVEETEFYPTAVSNLEEVGIVFFSSGTTGSSKAIVHNHYSLICQTWNNANSGFNFDLTFGLHSPYWTVYISVLGTSIVTGTARLVLPKFDRNNPWEPFQRKPNYVILNVFQTVTLCEVPKPEDIDVSVVKDVIITGGIISSEQLKKFQSIFYASETYILYGQTEVFGYMLHFSPKDYTMQKAKPTSAGRGLPGISYKIVDLESEATLGPNEKGELRVKTKYAMVGYKGIDSSNAWDENGWLKTGDVAYYDEDRCLYVVERIKEMFKFQGWHVTPFTIEKVLLQHPAVASAVVLGVAHAYDGHRPMGIVVLKPDCAEVTAEQIRKFVDVQVEDRLRLRGGLKIVDGMPMTASGKINRWKLKTNLGLS